jgi:sterol desaturase/sphingolipid hydroxylase (fatty acid hydroxylase superfamily)
MMTDAARDEMRTKVAAAFGRLRFYHPVAHLAVPSLIGLAAMIAALATLDSVDGWEWAVPPAMYVFSNAAEWRIHRDLLHKRNAWIPWLYERHTLMHHRVFPERDMEIKGVHEFGLVLLPPEATVLLVFVTLPPAVLIALAGAPDAARLFFATAVFYVLSYEWLHLAFHLPTRGPLGGVIATLRRHHAKHHDPAHMSVNYNVTVPLWDVVRGTLHREGAPGRDRE